MASNDRSKLDPSSASDPLLGFSAEGVTLDSLMAEAPWSRTYRGRTADGEVRQVVILADHLAHDATFLARLHQEAQHLCALRHMHVETFLGIRTWGGPGGRALVVLVSESTPGVVLSELVRREPLSVRDVLRVFQQACSGLAAAHRMGIVHGDVTPDAISVSTGGVAKLHSFALGISGFSADGAAQRLMGSADFMAPEVGRGQQPSVLSDHYGLGAALMMVLTGGLPYPAAAALEAIHLHGSAPVPDIAAVHPHFAHLAPLLQRLMAKDPAQRGKDSDDLARELLVLSSQVAGDLRCLPWVGSRPVPLAARVQTALTSRPELPPMPVSPAPTQEAASVGTASISRKSTEFFRNPDLFKPTTPTPSIGSPISPALPGAPPQRRATTRVIRRSLAGSSGSDTGVESSAVAQPVVPPPVSPPRTASYLSQLAAQKPQPADPPSSSVTKPPAARRAGLWIAIVTAVIAAVAVVVVLGMPRDAAPSTVVAPPAKPPAAKTVSEVLQERMLAINALAATNPAVALAQAATLRREHPAADLRSLPVSLRLDVQGPALSALQVVQDGRLVPLSPDGVLCRKRDEPTSLQITAPGYLPLEVRVPASPEDEVVHHVVLLDEPRWAMPAFTPAWARLLPARDGILLASDRKVVRISLADGEEIERLDRAAVPALAENATWAAVLSSGPESVRLAAVGGLCLHADLPDLRTAREFHRGQSSVFALQILPLTLRLGEEGVFLIERDAAQYVLAADTRERRLWSRPVKGGLVPWLNAQGDHLLVVGEHEVQRFSQEGELHGRWPLPHPRTGEPLALGRTALLIPTAGGLLRVEQNGMMSNPTEGWPIVAFAATVDGMVAAGGYAVMSWNRKEDAVEPAWQQRQVVVAPRRITHVAMDEARIVVADDRGTMQVFDRTGKALRTIRPGAPLLTSPLIHGRLVIAVMGTGVVAAF